MPSLGKDTAPTVEEVEAKLRSWHRAPEEGVAWPWLLGGALRSGTIRVCMCIIYTYIYIYRM